MMMTNSIQQRCLLLLLISLSYFSSSIVAGSALDYGLVEWLSSHEGGFFNPKQEVKRKNTNDPSSVLQVFARETIEEGDVLMRIPWELIMYPTEEPKINGGGNPMFPDLSCSVITKLIQEFGKGDKSTFSPYLAYLKGEEKRHPVPAIWSTAGQYLLVDILGGMDQELPPGSAITLLESDFIGDCNGDEEDKEAAAFVMQKAENGMMIPLYDLYTHRNGGDFYNVAKESSTGEWFKLSARRRIEAGEPLHNSYDLCDSCDPDPVDDGYGTAEIFRDHGFLEPYPQRWSFQPDAVQIGEEGSYFVYSPLVITFEIIEEKNGDIRVEWVDHLEFDNPGRNHVRHLFRKELRRLYRVNHIQYDLTATVAPELIPQHEWDSATAFYWSASKALKWAIHSLINDDDEDELACTNITSSNEGRCESALTDIYDIHYDDLKFEEDGLDYIVPTCPRTQLLEFEHFDPLETLHTNYQKLWFMERNNDDDNHGDICMNIENTLQICSEYRPHYHEFFVHFPARFLDSVKRVIFVGGGDAMLLHEVLKYPSLEKVVGLELDQQVTRKSFKWFKSQPHWDDDRVDWWYGDATKSLPLLPREYWGSFDLVLVDLSETVMSMSVTGGLDIFSALSLLLKPEGIMVKNEPYIEQFSNFFDYSIHIFYGTPKICTQVLVMGSNQVDFLHHETKDHAGIERHLLEPLDASPQDRYKYYHDYRKRNAREQGKCRDTPSEIQYGKKAGLLEIVEAEQVTFAIDDFPLWRQTIIDVLEGAGLTPLQDKISDDNGTIVLILKEGYVVARAYSEHNYVGFDVNLWGAFTALENLKTSLVKATGSSRWSSFRVVVGGMHGSSTWETDKSSIGVSVSETRQCEERALPSPTGTTKAVVDTALTYAIEMTTSDNPSLLLICGYEDEECPGKEIMEKSSMAVTIFHACPDLRKEMGLDYSPMYACERKLRHLLLDEFEVEKDLHVVVMDPSVPFEMAQITQSILAAEEMRSTLLAPDHVIVALSQDIVSEPWRRNLLERYRQLNHNVPLSMAEIAFRAEDHPTIELGILSTDDIDFFRRLRALEKLLKDHIVGFDMEVTTITGGIEYFDSEYDDRVFEIDEYDASPATAQAADQKSLGRQSIFQFEHEEDPDDDDEDSDSSAEMPTVEQLGHHLEEALKIVGLDFYDTTTTNDVGDGAMVVSRIRDDPKGLVLLIWDGAQHVDINLFRSRDDKGTSDEFVEAFAERSGLTRTLRDDQPRGFGRVVLFSDDAMDKKSGVEEDEDEYRH